MNKYCMIGDVSLLPNHNKTGVHDPNNTLPSTERADLSAVETSDGLSYQAEPDRFSRILWLTRRLNEGNRLPDKLCGAGVFLYAGISLVCLLLWGVVFKNRTMLLLSWAIVSPGMGLPLFLLAYVRAAAGLASWLHRFRKPLLTLGEDRLVFELTRHTVGRRPAKSYRWVMPYAGIRRMEYERGSKTLRIFGSFDLQECRLPHFPWLPAGMCRRDYDTPSAERNQYVDLPLVFRRPDKLLPELQERTGRYIHPAVRGDDLVDLRDLPGAQKDRTFIRPAAIALMVFTALTPVASLIIRDYYEKNPYAPFPPTEPQYLERLFEPGERVVLDGCEITLGEISRTGKNTDGQVGYSLLLTLLNHNEPYIMIRVGQSYKDSESNVVLTAKRLDGTLIPIPVTAPPRGYVETPQEMPERLMAGKSTNVNLFFYMPEEAEDIILTINSDYWPPRNAFRDVHYTGGKTEIGGQSVKNNEVRYRISRALFE